MKKRQLDYSSSIADMMSGLAIIFILLFILLLISFGKQLRTEKKIDSHQEFSQKIERFLSRDDLNSDLRNVCNCTLCDGSAVKSLESIGSDLQSQIEDESVGIYFKIEQAMFESGGKDFNENEKEEIACVVNEFVKKIVLDSDNREMIANVFFEAKGDFSLGIDPNTQKDKNIVLNNNEISRSERVKFVGKSDTLDSLGQIGITLSRSYNLIKLLGRPYVTAHQSSEVPSYSNEELLFLSAKLSATGLGWSHHFVKLCGKENELCAGDSIPLLQDDATERSIQIRVLLRK